MRLHHWYCTNNQLNSGEYVIEFFVQGDCSVEYDCFKEGEFIKSFQNLEQAIEYCEGVFNE